MIAGKFNVLVDAAWGSSGKGKVAAWLAALHGATAASTCNMPNAGHTVQNDGKRLVYKVLPAASVFGATSFLGPGTVYDKAQLEKERQYASGRVIVHERAMPLLPEHAEAERASLSKISSTMQGSGAALAQKILRQAALTGTGEAGALAGHTFRSTYHYAVRTGTVLHEVSQGWGLSIDHGTHYPHCTSRNCGVGAALDQMAMPPQMIGDVYLVVRSFPIRVGNTADGYSGDFLPDQTELRWEDIEARTGLTGLAEKERTTVTKRIRRVATFSSSLLQDAAKYNGATKLVITFPEYIDARALGARRWRDLPVAVLAFVRQCERITRLPVVAVSTGPETQDMVS